MLFVNITSKTIIKNIENDKILNLDEIEDKSFNVYPILYILSMNLYNFFFSYYFYK